MRVNEEDGPPSRKRKRFQHKYSKISLDAACKSVKEGDLSLEGAVLKYDIPRSTIDSRLRKDGYYCKDKIVTDPVLPVQIDREVVQWIRTMNDICFGYVHDALPFVIREICEANGEHTVFPVSNLCSLRYCKNFLENHQLYSENLSSENMLPSKIADNWVKKLKNFFEEIYNMKCEKFLKPKSTQVFCVHHVGDIFRHETTHQVSLVPRRRSSEGSSNQHMLSMYSCVSSLGDVHKPIVAVRHKATEHKFINNENQDCFVVWCKEGKLDGDSFMDWLQHTIPFLEADKIPKPYLFFIEQTIMPLSMELLKFCRENMIMIFYLPFLRNDILFPFGKEFHTKLSEEFLNQQIKAKGMTTQSKQRSLKVITDNWNSYLDKTSVLNQFISNGIIPLDVRAMRKCIKLAVNGSESNICAIKCEPVVTRSATVKVEPNANDSPLTQPLLQSTPIKNTNVKKAVTISVTPAIKIPNIRIKGEQRESDVEKKSQTELDTMDKLQESKKLRKKRNQLFQLPRRTFFKRASIKIDKLDDSDNSESACGSKPKSKNTTEIKFAAVDDKECVKAKHQDYASENTNIKTLTLENGEWVISKHEEMSKTPVPLKKSTVNCLNCCHEIEGGRNDGIKEGIIVALSHIETNLPQDLLELYKIRYSNYKAKYSLPTESELRPNSFEACKKNERVDPSYIAWATLKICIDNGPHSMTQNIANLQTYYTNDDGISETLSESLLERRKAILALVSKTPDDSLLTKNAPSNVIESKNLQCNVLQNNHLLQSPSVPNYNCQNMLPRSPSKLAAFDSAFPAKGCYGTSSGNIPGVPSQYGDGYYNPQNYPNANYEQQPNSYVAPNISGIVEKYPGYQLPTECSNNLAKQHGDVRWCHEGKFDLHSNSSGYGSRESFGYSLDPTPNYSGVNYLENSSGFIGNINQPYVENGNNYLPATYMKGFQKNTTPTFAACSANNSSLLHQSASISYNSNCYVEEQQSNPTASQRTSYEESVAIENPDIPSLGRRGKAIFENSESDIQVDTRPQFEYNQVENCASHEKPFIPHTEYTNSYHPYVVSQNQGCTSVEPVSNYSTTHHNLMETEESFEATLTPRDLSQDSNSSVNIEGRLQIVEADAENEI